MMNRRQFLGTGLAALSATMLPGRTTLARQPRHPACLPTGAPALWGTQPIRVLGPLGPSTDVGGLPFSPIWHGDDFPNRRIPFHSAEANFPDGAPPEPQEHVDVAIVGGGLSGLACAYFLRDRRPVLFELHPRFGGTSQGELWNDSAYSLGGAYFITPDRGSFLDDLYRDLGVHHLRRESPPSDDQVELNAEIVPRFWEGRRLEPIEREAFAQYAALVARYVDQYPEIPLVDHADNRWILELDRLSLRDHITQSLSVPVPTVLRSAIQGYCYSSFNIGWSELSAASGWNFISAEEFGRWVLPGGNAGLAGALWARLAGLESRTPPQCPPMHLRAGCRVVDVRVLGTDRCQVTWKDAAGVFRSLTAKRVIVCCPKHVSRHIVRGLENLDPDFWAATYQVNTTGYVVANILLDRPRRLHFYDLFLLRDGTSPDGPEGVEQYSRVTDAINGTFARRGGGSSDVLTLYWPLPFHTGRFTLIYETGWQDYANRLVPQVCSLLDMLDIPQREVRQIRMTRWGHAMPLATPDFIARGFPQILRRPFLDHVFFASHDNWCLPAVETALLEASHQSDHVRRSL